MKIGEKIKNYRQRAGVSQMDLELAIDAAFGSVSRIENNKVNPTKETLISISKTIGLSTNEIADLFGIDLSNDSSLLELVSTLHEYNSLDSLSNYIVNDFALKLGYLGALLLLKDDEESYRCKALTSNNISSVTFDLFRKFAMFQLTDLVLNTSKHSSNIIIKAISQNTPQICSATAELGHPVLPSMIANLIQKYTGDKMYGIFPISYKEMKLGAIVYAKKVAVGFESDSRVLLSISKQLGLALKEHF